MEKPFFNNDLLLQKLLEASTIMVYVFDVATKVPHFISKRNQQFLGYSKEEIIALGGNLLEKLLHPDDWKNYSSNLQHLLALKDEEELSKTDRYKTKNGNYRWFKNTRKVFSRNPDGSVKETIGIIQEITNEIKSIERLSETESKFRAIFNSTSDFNFFVDADYTIITLNQAAINYTEKHAGIQLRPGLNLRIAMPLAMHKDAEIAKDLALKGQIVDITKEYPSATGLSLWFRAKFFPVYDEILKTVTGVNINMRDVTKTVHANNALEQQNEQLREIARINSHDIRRPLANILGLVELLKHSKENYSADVLDLIELLHQSSLELDNVVKNIVDTSQSK